MKCLQYLAAVIAVAPTLILAAPSSSPRADENPYLGVEPHVNKGYATKLEETIAYFESQNDTLNAGRTRTV
jgi:cellulose 1,4-beta-cellobiosidase